MSSARSCPTRPPPHTTFLSTSTAKHAAYALTGLTPPRACRCWRHAAHPLPPQKAAPAPCTAPPRKACGSQAAAALIRWPSPGEPLLPVIPRSRRAHLGRASEAPTLRRQISSVPVRSPRALPKSPCDGKSAIQPLENLRTFQERQPHGDPLPAHPHWRGLFIFA